MLSPRQIFEDNIRPADLLLKVFRLLEHDAPNTEEAFSRSLRELVKAEKDEGLMVISNDIFLGLIRERAEVPPAVNQAQRPVQSAAAGRCYRLHRFGDVPANLAEGQSARSHSAARTRFRAKERRSVQEPIQEPDIRP